MDKEKLRRIIEKVTHVNKNGKNPPSLPGVFQRVNMYYCNIDVRLHLAQQYKEELEVFIRGRRRKFFSELEPEDFGRAVGHRDETLIIRFMAVGEVLGFWDLIVPKKPGDKLRMFNFHL